MALLQKEQHNNSNLAVRCTDREDGCLSFCLFWQACVLAEHWQRLRSRDQQPVTSTRSGMHLPMKPVTCLPCGDRAVKMLTGVRLP